MAIPMIAVYGTAGGDFSVEDDPCQDGAHWWHPWSPWWTYMRELGFVPFREGDDFCWTGGFDGTPALRFWRWLNGQERTVQHRQWYAGGQAYVDYVGATAPPHVVVAHSDGGQVALYGAAAKRDIPLLITVSTPHRADMARVIERARPHIGFWIHVYDPDHDYIARLGSLGDGECRIILTQPRADLNIPLIGCEHSLELQDPSKYHFWQDAVFARVAPQLAAWRPLASS